MLLSRGDGNPHDPQRAPFALQATDLSSYISRAQALMRDGRHVDAASLLSQHRWRQDMAAAEASMIVHMLCECAQRCAGRSQDIVVLGIQMCRDAQTVAEGTGLAPQQLLPVLLAHGQLQLSLGSFSEAIDMFQRVCYFDKSFGSYQPSHALMLASALRQSGQSRDAMSHANAAVQRLRIEHAKMLARYNAAVSSGDHAGQGIVYPELASTHGTLVRGLHEIASKGDPAAASVWTQQAQTLNETHARTLMLRSGGGRLSHRAAHQGVLPPSLITRPDCNADAMNDDSDCSLQSLEDDIDAPSASRAPHAAASGSFLNQVMSPSAPSSSSFVRRQGGGHVVLPSIDALLSARADVELGHLHDYQQHQINRSHVQPAQPPSFENHERQLYSSSFVQQELDPRLPHHQHGIFLGHAHPDHKLAAPALPSRQSLRVVSSLHAEASRQLPSHQDDALSAAVYTAAQDVSRIPRPSTSAADASAAKEARVPDGRFEFVGASIADGRRKQLARPSTAHPSRPGRRQHAAVAHLFDAKQAVTGARRDEGSRSGGEYSQVIGSPVDSANGSHRYDGVGSGGSNDDESAPIDSRNVSGSDDGAGSYLDGDDADNQTDENNDDSDVCTRDEELSVPGDDEGQTHSDNSSRSVTPSSDGSWDERRPVVPPLDLRAISSVDHPFESDGEAPPPPDDAESSSANSSDEYTRHNQQQDEHDRYHHQNTQQQHYNQQPEPESLSVFKRGIRDLAARHRKPGGLASQRLVASRLNAAAISLQCAWRARSARFVALDMLRSVLENQHRQREHQEDYHEQSHQQRSRDHFREEASHEDLDSQALDANDQETLSLISEASSPPSMVAEGKHIVESSVSSLREALQPLLQDEMQRMHATIARALEQQEAAISSILASSLPPRPPLPQRIAASPVYSSPLNPHLRVSALVGGTTEGLSPMDPNQDGEEREYEGAPLASAAPTPAILSHSPGTYHHSFRNDPADLSAVASMQPLFPSHIEAGSSPIHSTAIGASGGSLQVVRGSSFMEHNRQLLNQTLKTVASLGSVCHSLPFSSSMSAPLSPGHGDSCSVFVQTDAPTSMISVHLPSPSSSAHGITVACQCNLLSADECSTLISSVWRGHVTRLLFLPVIFSYRRTNCIKRIQKVIRGHRGRRLFLNLHSLDFRRKIRTAARLISVHCARAILFSRMRARVARTKAGVLASFVRVALATATYRFLRAQRVLRNISEYKSSCATALQAVFRSFIARRSASGLFSTSPLPVVFEDPALVRRRFAASVLIKYCLYALDRRDAKLHLAAVARARIACATVTLRSAVKYFLRKFRTRLFPRKRSAAIAIQIAWLAFRARAARCLAARTIISKIVLRNVPVILHSGLKEWRAHRLQWMKAKRALFARLHSSQMSIALAWKCGRSRSAFSRLLHIHRRSAAASIISINWHRHVALRLFHLQSARMRSFLEAAARLQENGPIKHALLQEQRAIDSRRALSSATEILSPKPQPLRRLAAGKIYSACRILLSKCALRKARDEQLAASARAIQRATRRHWQRTNLNTASAFVAEQLLQRRLKRAVIRITSCTRGFIVRRAVLQSLAWKCRPALWPILKYLVASIRAAIIFRHSLFNPAFRYGQATALALSLQCARRRRNDLQRFAAAHLLRLIQPVAPIFQRFLMCLSHQARARVMICEYLQEDAHELFLHGKATVLQCAVRCRAARKDFASELLTTEMLREHQKQSDACALMISCLRRIVPREVWCRTFGGVTLVYCQNRNAVRRRYSEALLRHWEKLKEKERKAAERLEKRSRMWTAVSAAARRLLCSSAHAETLRSIFAHEYYRQSCCILLGFKVLACAKRRAYRRSIATYSRLISYAVSGLHRRSYIRAIKLVKTGASSDEVPLHAPTPPWLEISRSERLRTVDQLKRMGKWSEFFSKLAAQQPSPAAFTINGAETESGIEAGSFHAAKQESVPSSPAAAAATPMKSSVSSSKPGSQDKRSAQPTGLKPLAPNVCPHPPLLNVNPTALTQHSKVISVSLKSVSNSPAPKHSAALSSSMPVEGLQQKQQPIQQEQPQSSLSQPRPPMPPSSSQAPASSAPFAPSPLVTLSSEPAVSAFPEDDGGYEPDDGANLTKKHRKKSKERQSSGDAQAQSKSSESAPAAGDAFKPPRFRKSDPSLQHSETVHAAGSKPQLQRTGSNASIGSGSAASQEFSAVTNQASLLAFKAARFGHHDQLAQAFTAGVSPDVRDDKSYTLLMQSAMNGNMRCMKACLRAGSDMDAVNNDGNTAAHLAFKFNHSDLGEYLLSKGASDSIENKDGLVCRALARSQPQA